MHRRASIKLLFALSALLPASSFAAGQDLADLSNAARLRAVEVSRIGGYDDRPEYLFASLPDGAVLSQSHVALLAPGSLEVRVFGTDGVHQVTVAGRGGGPGEFNVLRQILATSDGHLVAHGGGRLAIYTSSGELLSTLPASGDLVGIMEGGAIVTRRTTGAQLNIALMEPGPFRHAESFFLSSPDGEVPLHSLSGPEMVLRVMGNSRSVFRRHYEPSVVAGVAGAVVYVAYTGEASIQRIGADGVALESLQLNPRRRVVPASAIEAARDARMAEYELRETPGGRFGPPAETLQLRRERAESRDSFETFPEFRSLIHRLRGKLMDRRLPGARCYEYEMVPVQ